MGSKFDAKLSKVVGVVVWHWKDLGFYSIRICVCVNWCSIIKKNDWCKMFNNKKK